MTLRPSLRSLRWPGRFLAMALLVSLSSCGSSRLGTTVGAPDPLESVNRGVFKANEAVDRAALEPVAKGYQAAVPKMIRTGVSNVFDNLDDPFIGANQFLQGKPAEGFSDWGRFLMNSTVGLGGLFDPASDKGLPKHDEDFGQTLAVWGVDSGPYLVLPLLGPSTLRDAPTEAIPRILRLLYLAALGAEEAALPVSAVGFLSDRAEASKKLEVVEATALDPYLYIREAFLQRRDFLIRDGEQPAESAEDFSVELPGSEEASEAPAASPSPPPADDFSVELPPEFSGG